MLHHIDEPSPISLAHGEYYVGVRLWGQGGALARLGIGLFDRLTLGASYGGDKLLGADAPELYTRPEFFARGVILVEQGFFPDLCVGFESQGYGVQDPNTGDYALLPLGAFLAIGKTLEPTRTYMEIGGNYWRSLSGFAAVNQLLPGGFEIVLEYDLALNDDRAETRGVGFLNAGIAWTFNGQFRFGVGVRDILGNQEPTRLNRVIDFSFREHF